MARVRGVSEGGLAPSPIDSQHQAAWLCRAPGNRQKADRGVYQLVHYPYRTTSHNDHCDTDISLSPTLSRQYLIPILVALVTGTVVSNQDRRRFFPKRERKAASKNINKAEITVSVVCAYTTLTMNLIKDRGDSIRPTPFFLVCSVTLVFAASGFLDT